MCQCWQQRASQGLPEQVAKVLLVEMSVLTQAHPPGEGRWVMLAVAALRSAPSCSTQESV